MAVLLSIRAAPWCEKNRLRLCPCRRSAGKGGRMPENDSTGKLLFLAVLLRLPENRPGELASFRSQADDRRIGRVIHEENLVGGLLNRRPAVLLTHRLERG